MKNWAFIFSCLPLMALGQEKKDPLQIVGKVSGLRDGAYVALVNMNNAGDTVSKTRVSKGSFRLEGNVAEPNLYQLVLDTISRKKTMFIGNDRINITGDINHVEQLKVTGSSSHNDFVEFENTFNPLFQHLNHLGGQINAASQQVRVNPQAGPQYDSLVKLYTKQTSSISAAIDRFVARKTNSYVSPFLLVVTAELQKDPVLQERRFSMLEPKVKEGFFGKMLRQQIDNDKVGSIGSEAIDFSQADTSGKPISLSSFRGKYVLLDFWASWCRPCRMENPNVVAAFNKFKDRNFTVLSVSLDRDRKPWLAAIAQDRLTWSHVSDLKYWQNEVALKYRVQSIPGNFLISPEGKILGRDLRGEELTAKLCELLGGCN